MKYICLANCFLSLKTDIISFWEQFAEELRKYDIELVLLSTTDVESSKFHNIVIPSLLKDYANKNILNYNNSYEDYIDLVEIESLYNTSILNYRQTINGILSYKEFIELLNKILKPSFYLVWDPFFPQGKILMEYAKRNYIPVKWLERGLFPGTVIFESFNVLPYTDLKLNHLLLYDFLEYLNYDGQVDFSMLKEFLISDMSNKYNHKSFSESIKICESLIPKDKKVITFFGHGEVIPKHHPISNFISPNFESVEDILKELKFIIDNDNDLFLIFKKKNFADANNYSIYKSNNILIMPDDLNPKALMELSDLLIFGNTTLQFESIVFEKPVLLLTNTQFGRLNIFYEIENRTLLKQRFYEALNRVEFDKKLKRMKNALKYLLDKYLVSYNNNVKTRFSINDLAKFISYNVFPYKDLNDSIQRINELKETLEFLKAKNLISDIIKVNQKKGDTYNNSNINFENLSIKRENVIEKNNESDRLYIAETFIEQNKLNDASKILDDLINVNPYNIDALNDLAVINILSQNYIEAFNKIISVLQLYPYNEVAINNLNYLVENNKLDPSFFDSNLDKLPLQDIYFNKIYSFEDYLEYEQKMMYQYKERKNFEQTLIPDSPSDFTYRGYCIVCKDVVHFQVNFKYSYQIDGKLFPNWREHLVCPNCGLNNRMRLTYHLIQYLFNDFTNASVYITEQITGFYKILQKLNSTIIGSEFLGDNIPLGTINVSGIRNEDLTKLTFEDEKFDYLISLDVLEHIPDYKKAVKECLRVLKPNGTFLFTVPFNKNSKSNIVYAILEESGTISHLLPPEYHSDPISDSGEGSLCYYHFGWELLDELRDIGFKDAYAVLSYSKAYGYLGEEQLLIIANK
ncbi:MAG: methyltransferase domain-containing protein [Melioribacteraceae bacterium]